MEPLKDAIDGFVDAIAEIDRSGNTSMTTCDFNPDLDTPNQEVDRALSSDGELL